jgi:cell division protein FtsZ
VEIIWGVGKDESLEDQISVTVVATGFDQAEIDEEARRQKMKRYILNGHESQPEEITEVAEPQTVRKENIELFTKGKPQQAKPLAQEVKAGTERRVDLSPEVSPDGRDERHLKKAKSTTVGQLFKDKDMTPPRFSSATPRTGIRTPADQGTQEAKAQERIQYLKDLSIKLKSQSGLTELENEPAFVRRNVKLSDSTPSSDKIISRYSLLENDENQTELKSDNTYLHDNVD